MRFKNYVILVSTFIGLMLLHILVIDSHYLWQNVAFHSAIEAVGGTVALILSFILINKGKDNEDYPTLYLMGISFSITGLFDLAHSFIAPGNSFVLLHTLAIFFGSLVLLMLFFKKTLKKISRTNFTFYITLTMSVIISGVIIVFPAASPTMIADGKFTNLSYFLNVLAGFLYLISIAKLIRIDAKKANYDYRFFIFVLLLQSVSGFTFYGSQIWNIDWWAWHLFRLVGYFILAFVILRQLKELKSIQQKNKELEEFTYITSHDLQEPLNSMISFSSLLEERKYMLDETGKKSIEIIVSSSYRMKDFIMALLDYSRIGKQDEKKVISIIELIEGLKNDLHDLIEKSEASINYIGKPLHIEAFEPDFIKLFQNLISNGIKYTDSETKPKIVIDAKEQTQQYKFSITDNGIGIAKEHYDKIFEVFQRLHPRDKSSGTGIGLSHCKKVVQLHDGEIWLTSEIGKGTTFYFTISK